MVGWGTVTLIWLNLYMNRKGLSVFNIFILASNNKENNEFISKIYILFS